jgi:SAM-dependent methyltransferase
LSWREFWNGSHPIYVNARHRALHFDMIGKDIAALIPARGACVLDFGCGEAGSAEPIAARCSDLYLYDTASNVRERLRLVHGSNPRIHVLDDDMLELLPSQSLDMIVINSVIQYLSHGEFESALDLCRGKLKPTGKLVIGDVIPRDANALDDTKALLDFAVKGGFLMAAVAGLAATFFSDYRKLRSSIGLTRYAPEDVLTLLSAHGFEGARAAHNIGHNQHRMMFVATPR